MQKDSKFFEDIARLASGTASGFFELKHEIEAMVGAQIEKILQKMRLATREEVDTLHAMLAKAREEQESLKQRLEKLEDIKK